MIIDLILDRKDYEMKNPGNTYQGYLNFINSDEGIAYLEKLKGTGKVLQQPYNPRKFYTDIMRYGGYYANNITYAMDYFGETMVQKALCEYIIENEHNPEICEYVKSVNWLIPA